MDSPTTVDPAVAPGRRIRIDSRRRWFPDLRQLFRYRQLAVLLGRRDITVRYRQTVLGTIWIFAGTLVTAGLFSFVFGRVADLPSGGVPYFAFSYAGLLAWNLFSNTLTNASTSLNPERVADQQDLLPAAGAAALDAGLHPRHDADQHRRDGSAPRRLRDRSRPPRSSSCPCGSCSPSSCRWASRWR